MIHSSAVLTDTPQCSVRPLMSPSACGRRAGHRRRATPECGGGGGGGGAQGGAPVRRGGEGSAGPRDTETSAAHVGDGGGGGWGRGRGASAAHREEAFDAFVAPGSHRLEGDAAAQLDAVFVVCRAFAASPV